MAIDAAKIELKGDDGTCLVSLVFSMSFFLDYPMRDRPGEILDCIDQMLAQIPEACRRWYATETMSKYKPVTARTRTMLPTWLSPEAKPREYIAIEIKDGETTPAAPHHMLKIFSEEAPDPKDGPVPARMLRLAMPSEIGVDRAEDMANLFADLAAVTRCRHAIAGFGLVTSRYRERPSQGHALARSMRHPGLDLLVDIFDCRLVSIDAIKGVGWLTMIDKKFAAQLGGERTIRQQVSGSLGMTPISNGLILRAGTQPQIGDTNRQDFLPDYEAAFAIVRPLLNPALSRLPTFTLDDADPETRTLDWLTRFERRRSL